MKIKLSIQNRIVLNDLYPIKTTLDNQLLAKGIAEKCFITQKEVHTFNFKYDAEAKGYTWDRKVEQEKEYEFSVKEIAFLQSRIEALNKQESITRDLVDLCVKLKGL